MLSPIEDSIIDLGLLIVCGVERPDLGVHLAPGDVYLISGLFSILRPVRDDDEYALGEFCPGSIVKGSYGVPILEEGPLGGLVK